MQNPPGGYPPPGNYPPPGEMTPAAKTQILNLDGNVAGLVAYIFWPLALVWYLKEPKNNRFVRFHSFQALLLIGGYVVAGILQTILAMILGSIGGMVGSLLYLVLFIGVLFCAFKAYKNEMFKLPVLGGIAEKMANK